MDAAEFLAQIREGKSIVELGSALHSLAQQVELTGKTGSLTYTINIKPAGSGRITVDDRLSTKPPAAEREATLLYLDDAGNISRRDPRQMSFNDLK